MFPATVSTTRLGSVRVVFEKPIDASTFTYEDMILRVQGGDNLMNNTVAVTEVNSTTFDVDISSVTLADGYYVLTVQTTGIANLLGEAGVLSKQASWSQFTNTPAVQEFVGLPDGAGAAFDNMMIRFTVPIDTLTLTPGRLAWTKTGKCCCGFCHYYPDGFAVKTFQDFRSEQHNDRRWNIWPDSGSVAY